MQMPEGQGYSRKFLQPDRQQQLLEALYVDKDVLA